jgi:DNA-binding protein YbaB
MALFEDLDGARRWVDDWQSSIEDRAARARELTGRLSGLSATARDRDGLVEVTVAQSGVVTGLRLDERVRDAPAAHLARVIMAVMAGAQSMLVERVREATAQTLGDDSESGRAVVASYAGRLRDLPVQGGPDGHW